MPGSGGPPGGSQRGPSTPWWRDPNYIIGELAGPVTSVSLYNTLTKQRINIQIPLSQTLNKTLQQQLLNQNQHARAYSCSRLGKALDLNKTLEQNGIEPMNNLLDDSIGGLQGGPQEALKGGSQKAKGEEYTPTILLHFEDDLLAL